MDKKKCGYYQKQKVGWSDKDADGLTGELDSCGFA